MQPMQRLLLVSAGVRIAMIAWGAVQDAYLQVKYTDIDYVVFTDAARFVVAGESPFQRATYRYSPLLAFLVVPNVLWTPLWGKVLFASGDILAAWQIAQLCRLQHVPETRTWWSVVAWLYNPFTLTISTRGSCDVLVANMLLATLLLLFRGRTLAAALLYGLAVHFRIYPIVYAPAIVLYLAAASSQASARSQRPQWHRVLQAVVTQGAFFGCLSGGAFLALGGAFYRLYGQPFLQEAFLHHLGRKDPRHSFSLYFYGVYLGYADGAADAAGAGWLLAPPDPSRFAFAPQAALLLAAAVGLHRHLPLCWLVQTVVFVAFNKVCTAQYFVWYYSLLPLVLPHLEWPLPSGLRGALVGWVLTQLHWLLWGYLLEFQGQGVFLPLWAAGCAFLAANAALIAALLSAFRPAKSFLALSGEQRSRPRPNGGKQA